MAVEMLNRCVNRPTLLALALLALAGVRADAAPRARIYVLPVGKVEADELRTVTRALTAFFPIEIKQLPGIELPRSAYYRPRNRYRADKLLDHVESLKLPEDGRTVLAVTAAPISITKGKIYDWGIIGYVAIGGQICAYSTYYVKRGLRDPEQARERIGKIAVHEFAHNLGLRHCKERGCLMEDAQGTPLTFDRVYDFCPRCRAKLEKAGWKVRGGEARSAEGPETVVIPWKKPPRGAGPSDAYLMKLQRIFK
jgi:archaemetzincin